VQEHRTSWDHVAALVLSIQRVECASWGYCGPHRPEVLHISFLLSRISTLVYLKMLMWPVSGAVRDGHGDTQSDAGGPVGAPGRGAGAPGPGRARGCPRLGAAAGPRLTSERKLEDSLGSRTQSTLFFQNASFARLLLLSRYEDVRILSNSRRALSR